MKQKRLISSSVRNQKFKKSARLERGFALIVTLLLMLLLSLLAIGLLSLSSVALRSSGQSEAMSTARANAKLALMLAIGDLQKKAGPDQRVTAPANLIDASNPKGLTGVWESWSADPRTVSSSDYSDQKDSSHFLGYMTTNVNTQTAPDPSILPTGDSTVTLVGEGSTGSKASVETINAPVLPLVNDKGETKGGLAYVVMEDNTKARMDLEPAEEKSNSLGTRIAKFGVPARNGFSSLDGMEFLDADNEALRETLPKLISFKGAELMSEKPLDMGQYFHDFTVQSASLQTNVADGGLKTDLSAVFEGKFRDPLPGDYNKKFLYSNSDTPFPDDSSNSDIRWSFYANYARLYREQSTDRGSALDGLQAGRPEDYKIKLIEDATASPTVTRYEPRMDLLAEPILMPTVVRVDMIFSLVVRDAHENRGTKDYPYQLHMMYMPVITLHNPYNTPLKCKGMQVEFSNLPLGFQFLINGKPATEGGLVPFNRLYQNEVAEKAFSVTLSNSLTTVSEVVMGAGETLIFGTPFNPNATWASELESNGKVMFDWANNKTTNVKMVPGLITGPTDGIGFDIDFLAPDTRSQWAKERIDFGVILLGIEDTIELRYGPLKPSVSDGVFTITTRMPDPDKAGTEMTPKELKDAEFGKTQIIYKDDTNLEPILSEGTSPRFTDKRSFPADYPGAGSPPKKTLDLWEDNKERFRRYVKAKPFAVFSVGGKTTVESFTKSRPVADNGIAFHMATCDFRKTTSQGASPLELALVPIRNGSSAIESDGKKAFFFGGHGSTHGTTTATIYEIPLAPLQSIAQLRHANGASIARAPMVTYSVGESRAHPALDPSRTFSQNSGTGADLDHAWLANTALWDRYWFSTLSTLEGPAFTGSSSMSRAELANRFLKGEEDLPNSRNTPYFASGLPPLAKGAAEAAMDPLGGKSAAYMITEGGFNVNSTSVSAWTAVLSGLVGQEVPIVVGDKEQSVDSPFARFRRPVFGTNDANVTPKEKLWNSYRVLDADQVKLLAEEMVREVRKRGPFLSLSEFVNRRIGEPGELTNSGAIQAALDKLVVNAIMESNARKLTPEDVAGYGWKNPGAVTGNTGAGAVGEVSQGDVLSMIGSYVTVRSDTFVIRGYGDAKDSGGRIVAKAVCEATVQRFPEYVDSNETPDAIPALDVNIRFGRRFQIIAFRWLKPDEV